MDVMIAIMPNMIFILWLILSDDQEEDKDLKPPVK